MTVGANSDEDFAKGSVLSMREAGYNAYLYINTASNGSYCILVGCFSDKADAEDLLAEIRTLNVYGTLCDRAYIAHLRLSSDAQQTYSEIYWY